MALQQARQQGREGHPAGLATAATTASDKQNASSPTKAGDFEFLIKEQPPSDWSPGTSWLTDSKAGLPLEMSQVMGPGFKVDGVLDEVYTSALAPTLTLSRTR